MSDGRAAGLKTVFVGSRATEKRLRKSRLVVLEGPEAGRELIVAQERVTAGRSAVCDLTLTDTSVSTEHFSITAVDRGYLLSDEGSTNGTFYADLRVKEIWLKPGTIFRAGNTVLKFEPLSDIVTIALSARDRFDDAIGASIPMREIFASLERVAPSDLTVLIQGETGTGKEVISHAIHNYSRRAKQPFVVLDCSAIPRDLIESTLFGHEKGAFTGAVGQHRGVFEQADGGTIFLDEIGELDVTLQPKLLRALENREIKRVGGGRPISIDVRVLAATNRELRKMVTDGRFREDLYFRLSVMQVNLPPLRKRREDIPLLVEHFLKRANAQRAERDLAPLAVSPEALADLIDRPWPGNIRELKNVVERATSLGDGPTLTRQDFLIGGIGYGFGRVVTAEPSAIAPVGSNQVRYQVDTDTEFKDAKQALMDQFEAIYLKMLIEQHAGNISRSAKAAGLTRYHLRELLKKHEIDRG